MRSLAARIGTLLIGVVASFVVGRGDGGPARGGATASTLTEQDLFQLGETTRRAVCDSPRPDLEARKRGLDILGRLDGEGLPVPLTIALLRGLPGAVTSVSYVHGLTAFGAHGVVTWSLDSGAMPTGLTVSEAGELRGTPAEEGRYVLGLRARDASGQVRARPVLLEVQAIDQATPPPLADATVEIEYTGAWLPWGSHRCDSRPFASTGWTRSRGPWRSRDSCRG